MLPAQINCSRVSLNGCFVPHPSAITVFTPAQRNHMKRENVPESDLTGLKNTGVKAPLDYFGLLDNKYK